MADESKLGDVAPAPGGEGLDCEDINAWTAEANNGSEKHQLLLGLHFLKLAESNIDNESNSEKAVSWLLASSKQGNVEATEKLRHCVQTNLGINENNKSLIEWCIDTSASEKKIRHAAKSLFTKINSAHKGVLSKEEYANAINSLTVGHERERKLLLAAGRKIGTAISENEFVKIMSKKIHGTLTLTGDELDETSSAYNSAGIFKKVMANPRQTVMIALDRFLEYASKEGMNLVLSLIPTNQLYLLAFLFIYSYLTPGFFLLVIPLMAFFISFLVMVITTLQMFYKRRKQKDATTLAALLKEQFDADIDMESTESQYSWNSLTPYLVFFVSLPLMVMSFSLANKSYVPCAELFVVTLVMTGFCFLGLSDSHDVLTLLALGSHAFASLPVFLSNLPELPFLTNLIKILTRPFFSLYLGFDVSLHVSLPAIVHMLIPVLLFRMAMRGSWSGVHKIVIPHLICYFWFSFSTTIFPFTTWSGLARATIGYLLLPVFIPFSVFFVIIGIPYYIYKLLQTQMIGKLIVTALLLAVPILLTQTKAFWGKGDKKASTKEQKIRKIIMISFAVLGILPLLFMQVPTSTGKKILTLTWEDYKFLCVPNDDLWAPYQIGCRDFLGARIQWRGTVHNVKISKVENSAESVIKALPSIFSDALYCIYGEEIPECNEQTMSDVELRHCQLLRSTGQTCHLKSHNQVSLTLNVKVEEIMLNIDAGFNFLHVLMALAPGDEVEVSATLTDVGTPNPGLKLKSVTCTNRELPVMMMIEENLNEETIMKMLNDAFALVFNFGFFPFLEYSSKTDS